MGFLLILALGASFWKPLRPLRNYFIVMLAFFGIAHYFGTPGGIVGGILSIFMGWILGKSMVETRGFLWTWWIHFLSDIVIFTFVTAALVK